VEPPAEPTAASGEHPAEPKPPETSTPPAPDTSTPAGPVEPPPPPASGSGPREPPAPTEQPAPAAAGAGARPPPRLPTFAMPNLLGVTQAPTVGTALSEEYKGVVYGMLEKAKRDPDGPRPRPLSAVVTFDIDDAGNPRTIALARGSGRPDIDAEALALVRRAAPFPPPPPGVFRSFAPMIIFPAH
jgi:periplasmic protein TonB